MAMFFMVDIATNVCYFYLFNWFIQRGKYYLRLKKTRRLRSQNIFSSFAINKIDGGFLHV